MQQRYIREFARGVALLVSGLMVYACLAQQRVFYAPTIHSAAGALSPTVMRLPTRDISLSPTVRIPSSTSTPTPPLEPAITSTVSTSINGVALVEALRRGGYVIYFRHAASETPHNNAETVVLKDCRWQGNLEEQGRADARAIGESFLSLNIPVGLVLSSEYCRARDTAMLAFGTVEATEDLTAFPDEFREQRIAALTELLSTPPESGTNTVLVAHALNMRNAAGIDLEEGEAAIFTPLGDGHFNLLARVLSSQWIQLESLMVGSLQVGPVSHPDLLLPDLETLPPTDVRMRIHSITGQKLLRFTNLIVNNGPGPMELWGYSNTGVARTIVVQQVFTIPDSSRNIPVGEFIFHPEHDHWHMADFARYELWSVNLDGELESIAALADKVSYCLRDDERSEFPDAPRFQTYIGCNQKRQGITPGWIDMYKFYLEGQSMDVTHLPNGVYALRSVVNPNHQLWEAAYSNNAVVIYLKFTDDDLEVMDIADVILQLNSSDQ